MSAEQSWNLDAERWQRLKAHVAQLSELGAPERALALAELTLDDRDRDLLGQLLARLASEDQRLAAPLQRSAPIPSGLRWQAGECVGDYVIDGFLGRGGMSEVYAAHAQADGNPVAIKVLRQGLPAGQHQSFSDNERRALQRLNDPLIARFMDSFVVAELGICLVLERVDGEPLDAWCAHHTADLDTRLGLYLQVCQAVASAHRQLVIHRDLKPANVLVGTDGQIKLLDFGVAKWLGEEATHSQTHGGMYTLEFAAPEQVLGQPASAATDIYALGVLLFRLLTQASAYARGTHESLVKSVLRDRPRRLADAGMTALLGRPALAAAADLDHVVQRAMEKDPRDRYRSVSELVADVQSIRAGMPIRVGGGRWYRMARFVRRHPAGVAMSCALLVALLGATGVSLFWAQQAAAQAQQAASDARRATAANGYLLAVLDLNDSFSRRNSGDLTLAQVLDRAVELAATELADEPEVRADVLSKLSVALQRRGELQRASALADEALTLASAQPQPDIQLLATLLRRVGSVEVDLNRLDSAHAHLTESMRLMNQLAVDHRNVDIATMTSLARIAAARGDPRGALQLYEAIIPIRAGLTGDHRADAAMDQSNLAAALLYLSRFGAAAQAYERAIELLQSSLGAQHPRLGLVRGGYAVALIQLGRFDAASLQLQMAHDVLSAAQSGPNRHLAIAALNLAGIDYWTGDYDAAWQALQMADADLPPAQAPAARLWRGRVAWAQGDTHTAAEHFRAAAAGYQASGAGAHARRWLAQGLASLAAQSAVDASADRGDLAAALTALADEPSRSGVEHAELLWRSGAAARRRGDPVLALTQHQQCSEIIGQTGWLGPLGRAMIDAELSLDQLASDGAPAERAAWLKRLQVSADTLALISPHSPQLAEIRATLAAAHRH